MRKSRFLIAAILFGVLAVPFVLFAQDLQAIGSATGLSTELPVIIGRIIQVILSVLGVVILVLMIYSGYLWMTAGGNEEQVEKAKQTMIRAIVGFVIIIASFAITTFIMNLLGAPLFGGNGGGGDTGPGIPPFSNSLGNGGIIDHYPGRDQIGVPRNTRIIVTFKGIVSPEEFVTGYDDNNTPSNITDDKIGGAAITDTTAKPLRASAASIYRLDDRGAQVPFTSAQVQMGFSIIDTDIAQTSTYIFMVPVLDGETNYFVRLDDSIRGKLNGVTESPVDTGGYLWTFKTSNDLDLTPPQVQYVLPIKDRTYGRNIAVQMTFNEPMDPTSVSGLFTLAAQDGKDFTNIVVSKSNDAANAVAGVFALSNGYRTVTYLTFDACGTNSCGQTIYCLPATENIDVLIKSPNPDSDTSPHVAAYPPFGATDVVGNALDGNADGHVTRGTPDNYTWGFSTNNQIVLAGPRIESIFPSLAEPNEVALDTPISVAFNEFLLSSSFLSGAVLLAPTPHHDLWFTTRLDVVNDASGLPTKHTLQIPHGVLAESSDTTTYVYNLLTTEQIQNQYQNCFVPSEGPGKSAPRCVPTVAQPYCCNGDLSSTACIPRPT